MAPAVAGCASALSLTGSGDSGDPASLAAPRATGHVASQAPAAGQRGAAPSPKEKTWGPRERAPTAHGRAARAQGRRCRRPSSPFHRCARHTDTASPSGSFHPDIGPEPTAFILVRGELLNRTKDGRGREVGEGATEGGHVPAVPAGAWTGTSRCHRETRRPGRLPPAAVGTLVCLLLRTPPSGVFAVGPHRKT